MKSFGSIQNQTIGAMLLSRGYTLSSVSRSKSTYYERLGVPMIRVSSHNNERFNCINIVTSKKGVTIFYKKKKVLKNGDMDTLDLFFDRVDYLSKDKTQRLIELDQFRAESLARRQEEKKPETQKPAENKPKAAKPKAKHRKTEDVVQRQYKVLGKINTEGRNLSKADNLLAEIMGIEKTQPRPVIKPKRTLMSRIKAWLQSIIDKMK